MQIDSNPQMQFVSYVPISGGSLNEVSQVPNLSREKALSVALKAFFARSIQLSSSSAPLTERFNSSVITNIEKLNCSKDVIYQNDLIRDKQDSKLLIAQFKKQLTELGFVIDLENGLKYVSYSGNDPARALDALVQVKPLIIDCRQAMIIAQFLALKELAGAEGFNQIIKTCFNGVLSTLSTIPLFDGFFYYKSFAQVEDMQQEVALKDVQVGDQVYMLGPQVGFTYHQTSDFNGYHLVCVRIDKSGTRWFKGFASYNDIEFSFDDLKKMFLKEYHKPLTYADLLWIMEQADNHPNDVPDYGKLTYNRVLG